MELKLPEAKDLYYSLTCLILIIITVFIADL